MASQGETIYESTGGKMIQRSNVRHPDRSNFVIQVYIQFAWRDWSGFCTLQECRDRFHELETKMAEKPERDYRVVEV